MLPWGPTASINFDPRNTVQCPQIDQQLHRTPDWGLIGMRVYTEDIPLVELMYFVFTRMPGESYRRRLRSLLLCFCDVFPALNNSLVCWLLTEFVLEGTPDISLSLSLSLSLLLLLLLLFVCLFASSFLAFLFACFVPFCFVDPKGHYRYSLAGPVRITIWPNFHPFHLLWPPPTWRCTVARRHCVKALHLAFRRNPKRGGFAGDISRGAVGREKSSGVGHIFNLGVRRFV